MKKVKMINQPLSSVIASLGHTDEIVITDAGLPIPKETLRIDLALMRGFPIFEGPIKTVLQEKCVEKACGLINLLNCHTDWYPNSKEKMEVKYEQTLIL